MSYESSDSTDYVYRICYADQFRVEGIDKEALEKLPLEKLKQLYDKLVESNERSRAERKRLITEAISNKKYKRERCQIRLPDCGDHQCVLNKNHRGICTSVVLGEDCEHESVRRKTDV